MLINVSDVNRHAEHGQRTTRRHKAHAKAVQQAMCSKRVRMQHEGRGQGVGMPSA